MHEGEQCFEKLARVVPEPVWVVSADGHLLYGNPRWHSLTAISEGQVFPTAYVGLLHPDDRQHWALTWQGAVRGRCSYDIKRRVRSVTNGVYLRQTEHAQPVTDSSGHIVEWILTTTTAREEGGHVIADLVRSIERNKEAVNKVAHEMRSPLVPISYAVKLLERRGSDPACVENLRALIGRQVAQLTRLVQDLFDLARPEHRQLCVHKEAIDLRQVLAAAIETVEPMILAHGHRLMTTAVADSPVIHGDAGRLTQVLVNLLVNAAKFTNPGGSISISLERADASFMIKVRDTGIGMGRDMLARIFDTYVQLENKRGEGLGLGLALAMEIVQLHGGTLTAHSEGPGKGSEFALTLPAASAV